MPNTNGSLIWNNFQDQTSTAKVITPPKSMHSAGLNGICHMSGNFCEGRRAKFWYVEYIHYYSIIITACLLYLGLQCLANTSRTVDPEMCICPEDCNSLIYTTEISSEQLYPLYSQTFGLLSSKDNFLWKLDKKLQNAIKDKKLYEQKILKDNYDDIISSSSVVHFYFKERGIWKYSQEEVFGYTELVGMFINS